MTIEPRLQVARWTLMMALSAAAVLLPLLYLASGGNALVGMQAVPRFIARIEFLCSRAHTP